ncbi:MAG: lysophospholipid acyltransferase family protein [Cellvibrionaceae bacterium]
METESTNTRAISIGQRITYGLFRGFLQVSSWLPLSLARSIGRGLGYGYYKLAKKRVHFARINMQICFPELSEEQKEERVKQCLKHGGMWFMEAGAVWLWSRKKLLALVEVENPQLLSSAVEKGNGVILAVPHLGNWELMGPLISLNYEFACLYQHDQKKTLLISEFIQKRRASHGVTMAAADPSGVRTLYKHLKQGKIAGLLPDHNPTEEMGIFAPFYGRLALTGTLISSLAKKNNATVLTAIVARTKGGFKVYFREVFNQDSADPLMAATALNKSLEEIIAIAPEQFQWVYPRFKKRQDINELSPYR